MSILDLGYRELRGIVFTELEYTSQFDTYFNENTGTIYVFRPFLYFEKAHVVKTLDCTYVIVLIGKHTFSKPKSPAGQKIQARSNFYIADGADVHETIDGRISTDIEAFTDRFHTK